MRIGIDYSVSWPKETPGIEIVWSALSKESDEDWIETAKSFGAELVISSDKAALNYANRIGLKTICLPEGMKKVEAWEYIYGELNDIDRNIKFHSPYQKINEK